MKYSILDLVPYAEGRTIADAFVDTVKLAQHAEAWGYERFWLAEHHNLSGIASAATAVLIEHVATKTKTIRVGSGGIMLPNHSPLAIAEQFGTLATLHPNRIDLGLGRAPGTDQTTMRALRGANASIDTDFGELVEELFYYFKPAEPGQRLQAIPGAGMEVPIVILGSSLYSAHLAAKMGLPYSFAGHFAPALLNQALAVYRKEFQPSRHLAKPYVILGIPIVAAESDTQADFLATSVYQRLTGLVRGRLQPIPPPVKSMDGLWTEFEEHEVKSRFRTLIIGSVARVREGLLKAIAETQADEFIITSDFYSPGDRLRSYELIAQAFQSLGK